MNTQPPEIAAHLAEHYSDETLTGREIEVLSRSFPPKSTISRGGHKGRACIAPSRIT